MQAVISNHLFEYRPAFVSGKTETAQVMRIHTHEAGQTHRPLRAATHDDVPVSPARTPPRAYRKNNLRHTVRYWAEIRGNPTSATKTTNGNWPFPLPSYRKDVSIDEEIRKCRVGLRLPEQPGQHFGEEQSDRCFHRIAVDMAPHLNLTHIANTENILPRPAFPNRFREKRTEKKAGATYGNVFPATAATNRPPVRNVRYKLVRLTSYRCMRSCAIRHLVFFPTYIAKNK